MPVVAVLQSFLLVLGSALNPGALVVSAVYLAKERGARLETAFMTGGLIIGVLVGVIVLVLIRVTGLELPTNLTPTTASDWAWASSRSRWRRCKPGCARASAAPARKGRRSRACPPG